MPDNKPTRRVEDRFIRESFVRRGAALQIVNDAIVELQQDNVELGQD